MSVMELNKLQNNLQERQTLMSWDKIVDATILALAWIFMLHSLPWKEGSDQLTFHSQSMQITVLVCLLVFVIDERHKDVMRNPNWPFLLLDSLIDIGPFWVPILSGNIEEFCLIKIITMVPCIIDSNIWINGMVGPCVHFIDKLGINVKSM